MSRINIRAITIGSLVEVGGSLTLGLVFNIIYAAILAAQRVPQAEMKNRMLGDQSYFVVSLVVGFVCIAAGSYIAARMAPTRAMIHAGVVGFVGIAAGVLFSLGPDTARWPSWFLLISFGFTLPVALLGGFVARRRTAKSTIHERAA
jgi:hypothetical protein